MTPIHRHEFVQYRIEMNSITSTEESRRNDLESRIYDSGSCKERLVDEPQGQRVFFLGGMV